MAIRRTSAVVALAVATSLAAAACGGSGGQPTGRPTKSAAPQTSLPSAGGGYGYGSGSPSASMSSSGGGGASAVTVVASDYAFSPSKLSVKSGSSVSVENSSGRTPHTFTVRGKSLDVTLDGGDSQDVVISLQPGTYEFVCRFHESLGMKGTLKVT